MCLTVPPFPNSQNCAEQVWGVGSQYEWLRWRLCWLCLNQKIFFEKFEQFSLRLSPFFNFGRSRSSGCFVWINSINRSKSTTFVCNCSTSFSFSTWGISKFLTASSTAFDAESNVRTSSPFFFSGDLFFLDFQRYQYLQNLTVFSFYQKSPKKCCERQKPSKPGRRCSSHCALARQACSCFK